MINPKMSDKRIFGILSKAVNVTVHYGMVDFEMDDDKGDYTFYNDLDQDLYFYSVDKKITVYDAVHRDGIKVMEGERIRRVVEMVIFPEILPKAWPDGD